LIGSGSPLCANAINLHEGSHLFIATLWNQGSGSFGPQGIYFMTSSDFIHWNKPLLATTLNQMLRREPEGNWSYMYFSLIDPNASDSSYTAYIAESELLIVLAFRGTQSISNWRTNFHTWLIHPPDTDSRLRVHQGFYTAFERLSDGARGIKKAMEELHSSRSSLPVYITGRSLGGALAQIAAAVLGSDQIAACYTFGSPRDGNSYFDLGLSPRAIG
jgi:hypothetical protein